MDVRALAKAYRAGTLTPTQAVEACVKHLKQVDGTLKAWQAVYADEAMEAARIATERFDALREGNGIDEDDDLPLMYGIPFGLKDIIDVKGKVTTAGSATRLSHVALETAPVAARLLQAGGILIGKLKTVEFARGSYGTNQRMGTPINPWTYTEYTHLVPGGSSSGSGVAVASFQVPCAVGTDTGGSVRLPAAFCGVVGLKTTKHLLSTHGIVPLAHTFDTPGPLARSAYDAAIMCAAMMPAADRITFEARVRKELELGVRGMRIAVMGQIGRALVASETQLAAFDAAIATLRKIGADIVEWDFDPNWSNKGIASIIVGCEGYRHHRATIEDPSSEMDDGVRSRLSAGKEYTLEQYLDADVLREPALESFLEGLGENVAWLSPTTIKEPCEVADADESILPAEFCRFVNFCGLCSVSVPTGPLIGNESAALPTSLQITCKPFCEIDALRICAAYERARGPLRRPPLCEVQNAAIPQIIDATPFPYPLTGVFEASTTALIVIDFQRDFVEEEGYMSKCGYDVSVLAEPLPRVASLLKAARARGLTIIHTRQYSTFPEYSAQRLGLIGVTSTSSGTLGNPLTKGSPGFEIHPSVSPAAGELVIDKTACSAFIGTNLEEKLKERGIDKLIVCGITLDVRLPSFRSAHFPRPLPAFSRVTLYRVAYVCDQLTLTQALVCLSFLQVCVHSTLRHANDLGYQTLLLEDCVACIETPDVPALRETMLKSITIEGGIWGAVASSSSLIKSLEA